MKFLDHFGSLTLRRKNNMLNLLVTGGSGFIGSHLVDDLIERGHRVTITATSGENSPKVHKTLFMGMSGLDENQLEEYDCVFHLGANNDTLCQDKDALIWANAKSPRKFFENLQYLGLCSKFVYASSTAVYGNSPPPYVEDRTDVNPINPYAESKLALENEMKSFSEDNQIIGLRFCNVYGPDEKHKGKRMSVVSQMVNNKKSFFELFEPGTQRRDWVYVYDAVRACILAMNKLLETTETYHEIYNVGSGQAVTFNYLAEMIYGKQWKKQIAYKKCEFEKAYQSYTECDLTKINEHLGYIPLYQLEEGIKDYYSYGR